MFFSLLLASLALSAGAEPSRPISLVSSNQGGGVVELRVVGEAIAAVEAQYRLEVISGPSNGNRSVQSGSARLRAGERSELIRLRLGSNAAEGWSARLTVEPRGAASYEVVTNGASSE
jgi:hypothetical protein